MNRCLLHLPPSSAAQIIAAARARFPAECCGLLEGTIRDDGWGVLAVHETGNISEQPGQNFLIDPQAQIELLRRLRGSGREVIGCFHSHPYGGPVPSALDRESAADEGFIWLIAGGGPIDFSLAAWLFTGTEFSPIVLHPPADCGTEDRRL